MINQGEIIKEQTKSLKELQERLRANEIRIYDMSATLDAQDYIIDELCKQNKILKARVNTDELRISELERNMRAANTFNYAGILNKGLDQQTIN